MARYAAANFCIANVVGVTPGVTLGAARGLSVCRNLNTIIRDMQGDWVWFQADDHVFAPGLLGQLLEHDLDVVVPLVVRRQPPFSLVIFKDQNAEGEYRPFAYDEIPEEPFEVYAAGTGGMLVRRHVLDAIGDPWFTTRGDDIQNEDLEFCRRVRDAGYAIHCDPHAEMGHMGSFAVWPHKQHGARGPLFKLGEGPEGAMNTIFVNPAKVREPVVA